MNISYIFDWKGSPNTGVPQKIDDQIKIWQKTNCKVKLYVIVPRKHSKEWENKAFKTLSYNNSLQRLWSRIKCSLLIMQDKNINLVYRRYSIWELTELLTIFLIPTVIEINTFNKIFFKNRSFFFYVIYLLQYSFVSKFCLGACTVTEELRALQSYKLIQKSSVFTNSISLAKFNEQPVENTGRKNKRLSFVFIGSDSFAWNGLERINQLAKSFPSFDFHIIGINEKQSKNIFSHGPLYGEKLVDFLQIMDFGISTLGIDKLKLKQAAPLKSRTYLACGLPVIGAYRDSAFPQNAEYFLELKYLINSNEIVNESELLGFINKWQGKRVDMSSLSPINNEIVKKNRIDFFNSLINSNKK